MCQRARWLLLWPSRRNCFLGPSHTVVTSTTIYDTVMYVTKCAVLRTSGAEVRPCESEIDHPMHKFLLGRLLRLDRPSSIVEQLGSDPTLGQRERCIRRKSRLRVQSEVASSAAYLP